MGPRRVCYFILGCIEHQFFLYNKSIIFDFEKLSIENSLICVRAVLWLGRLRFHYDNDNEYENEIVCLDHHFLCSPWIHISYRCSRLRNGSDESFIYLCTKTYRKRQRYVIVVLVSFSLSSWNLNLPNLAITTTWINHLTWEIQLEQHGFLKRVCAIKSLPKRLM